jgi:hypothetical protein
MIGCLGIVVAGVICAAASDAPPTEVSPVCKRWQWGDLLISVARGDEGVEYRVTSRQPAYVVERSLWHGSANIYCRSCDKSEHPFAERERPWADVRLRTFKPQRLPPFEQVGPRLADMVHSFMRYQLMHGLHVPFTVEPVGDVVAFQLGPLPGNVQRFAVSSANFHRDIIMGLGHDGCVAFEMAIIAPYRGNPILADVQPLLDAFTISRTSVEIPAEMRPWLGSQR